MGNNVISCDLSVVLCENWDFEHAEISTGRRFDISPWVAVARVTLMPTICMEKASICGAMAVPIPGNGEGRGQMWPDSCCETQAEWKLMTFVKHFFLAELYSYHYILQLNSRKNTIFTGFIMFCIMRYPICIICIAVCQKYFPYYSYTHTHIYIHTCTYIYIYTIYIYTIYIYIHMHAWPWHHMTPWADAAGIIWVHLAPWSGQMGDAMRASSEMARSMEKASFLGLMDDPTQVGNIHRETGWEGKRLGCFRH